jgi:hypothetical protein
VRAPGHSRGSPPWASPALARRALPFASHCLRHFAWLSYRRGIGRGDGLSRRARVAAYDAMISLLLDGYEQLADHRLRPQTGALIVRLNRLIGAVDDEYERRLTGQLTLDFAELFGAAAVQAKLADLADFLKPYRERLAIRDYLRARVGRYYGTYVELTESDTKNSEWHLRSAQLDSAGVAECLADVIGLFHSARPHCDIVQQFSCFGMLGKVADDVIDFWDDFAAGRPNVLHGIVRRHPAEQERAMTAAGARHTGLRWWRDNCPGAYAEVAALIDDRRACLTSSRLRLAGDLVLIPAWYGRIATSDETIGLRE